MSNPAKKAKRQTTRHPASRKTRVPSLRHHKVSGQGYVVLNGKAVYLGKYGLPETEQRYHQTIAEWLTAGQQLPSDPAHITIKEVIGRFWRHARTYYVRPDGTTTSEVNNIRQALRPLRKLYGDTLAANFGPRALKAVRLRMIEIGWCRSNINKMVARIRRMFRWATEQEIVCASVYHALQAVPGLRRGRSAARETDPIRPAPKEHIDAIRPHVSRQVWALIQLQLLTGARSGELVTMKPGEIDRSGKVWVYTPAHHKTAHHAHIRRVYIGPTAQGLLAPFLMRDPTAYCFSPAEAEEHRRRERHKARNTPVSCGNRPGTNRKAVPSKKPGDHYTVTSYGRAIRQAVKKTFRPEGMSDRTFRTWKAPQHWHPHQLRHTYATRVRKEFGLEAAQILLGHAKADVTQMYAERDMNRAATVAGKIG